MAIDPNNSGVLLRRQFDFGEINQQADVRVDGQLVGRWYSPGQNADRRWRDEDFVLPASLTRGKSTIEITIEAVIEPSPWSETAYTVYCLRAGLAHLADGAPLPGR